MKILVIDNKASQWTPALDTMMRERGIIAEHLSPTLLSAITALKVGMLIDQADADLVVASTMSDTVAAMSGCNIAKRKARAVAMVPPSAKAPRGVPTAVASEVAAWIFPSEQSRAAYPGGLTSATVIAPISHLPFAAPEPDSKQTMLWAGPIDGNSERLRLAIRLVDSSERWHRLDVYGTGRAREVMPAVRDGRAMANPAKLQWLPQETTLDVAAARASAIVQAGPDPTGLELALAENGRQLLLPADAGFAAAPPYPATGDRADALASFLKSLC